LVKTAQAEVKSTLAALPRRVKQEAARIPVTYEPRPNTAMVADGIEPDTLGLFIGDDFTEHFTGIDPLPTQIILFLENLWEFSGHDLPVYREEVRRTLLHELGHYLGLDESDLEIRDLD
jgi:predicted Zn-dependent protease with MMP-like domain